MDTEKNKMGNKVDEFKIIERNENIFDIDGEYIIPLYQRAFAWEEKQLIQLVEDIKDVADGANYYIGSLVVSKKDNKYEVVDGQQRLTSLYLLLSCLGMNLKCTLTFACRDKSNYTLKKVHELLDGLRSNYDIERVESGIYQGIKILNEKLITEKISKSELLDKLKRVILYRIEVPENTDLNRYFEIMNTRGEQLEQHDILKATLMSYLSKDSDKEIFSKIWEACSDMTGYVQMHFDKNSREYIFDWNWGELPSLKWGDYKELSSDLYNEGNGFFINDIIKRDFQVKYEDIVEDNNRIRFESMIEFPYFLLHTIRVFVDIFSVESRDGKELLNDLLDDKKLIANFTDVVKRGLYRGKPIDDIKERENFSRKFIICLLRCRYLFDKYVIKREYANDNSDGEWSLKELHVSGQQSNKKPYYKNTRFKQGYEWGKTNDSRAKTNIMLQSALRVSYTSPKVMHWITDLLLWLSADDCMNTNEEHIVTYGDEIESIAKNAVKDLFFDSCPDGDYSMGVNTPHIVFNYLDFLLWQSNKRKYDDFVFEFRNSVEHWYPQHPSEGTFDTWSDGVDQFGNLCIIQRNVNSKFSNMSPEAKKSTFKDMIEKGSLKLRIMSDLTERGKDGKNASAYWKDTVCKEHEDYMIEILKNACLVE